MLTMSTLLKPQNSFHHGDLTHALISAGLKQVEKQGMESLGLRQLAMTTGVSPAAVYDVVRLNELFRTNVTSLPNWAKLFVS